LRWWCTWGLLLQLLLKYLVIGLGFFQFLILLSRRSLWAMKATSGEAMSPVLSGLSDLTLSPNLLRALYVQTDKQRRHTYTHSLHLPDSDSCLFGVTSEDCLGIYIYGPKNPPVTSPSSSSSFPLGSPRGLLSLRLHNAQCCHPSKRFYPISNFFSQLSFRGNNFVCLLVCLFLVPGWN
jgi:hypothetical protein